MAKKSKDLVPVGTHVPLVTKMTLQAMAESQNTTVYALIQEWIEREVSEYSAQIDELKEVKPVTESLEGESDDDLLS